MAFSVEVVRPLADPRREATEAPGVSAEHADLPRAVTCIATGSINDGEIGAIASAVAQRLDGRGQARVLIDARAAEHIGNGDSELTDFFARCGPRSRREIRVGLVVGSGGAFEQARRLERRLSAEGVNTIVFNSRRTARVWLGMAEDH